MIRGTDISHNNGIVNISMLPNDIAFLSMKASQGATYQDPMFQSFYHQVKNGRPEIIRIPYHFFDWEAEGVPQAQNILSRGVDYTEPGTCCLMLDMEADSGSEREKFVIANRALCIKRVNDFITYVQENSGRQELIIYSNDDFIKNVICHTWPGTIFWVASYQDDPPPFIPGWHFQFQQYSEYGKLDGSTEGGSFDLDRFFGTQAELNALANITS